MNTAAAHPFSLPHRRHLSRPLITIVPPQANLSSMLELVKLTIRTEMRRRDELAGRSSAGEWREDHTELTALRMTACAWVCRGAVFRVGASSASIGCFRRHVCGGFSRVVECIIEELDPRREEMSDSVEKSSRGRFAHTNGSRAVVRGHRRDAGKTGRFRR
ncbi:hypothetical protein EI94DRAFT_912603 [Lactarius quietus]|nr:hypothetical protein EI94DRAFT_912603 [Lactarius quietus]